MKRRILIGIFLLICSFVVFAETGQRTIGLSSQNDNVFPRIVVDTGIPVTMTAERHFRLWIDDSKFSFDDKYLAVLSDGIVRIYDVDTSYLLANVLPSGGLIYRIEWAKDRLDLFFWCTTSLTGIYSYEDERYLIETSDRGIYHLENNSYSSIQDDIEEDAFLKQNKNIDKHSKIEGEILCRNSTGTEFLCELSGNRLGICNSSNDETKFLQMNDNPLSYISEFNLERDDFFFELPHISKRLIINKQGELQLEEMDSWKSMPGETFSFRIDVKGNFKCDYSDDDETQIGAKIYISYFDGTPTKEYFIQDVKIPSVLGDGYWFFDCEHTVYLLGIGETENDIIDLFAFDIDTGKYENLNAKIDSDFYFYLDYWGTNGKIIWYKDFNNTLVFFDLEKQEVIRKTKLSGNIGRFGCFGDYYYYENNGYVFIRYIADDSTVAEIETPYLKDFHIECHNDKNGKIYPAYLVCYLLGTENSEHDIIKVVNLTTNEIKEMPSPFKIGDDDVIDISCLESKIKLDNFREFYIFNYETLSIISHFSFDADASLRSNGADTLYTNLGSGLIVSRVGNSLSVYDIINGNKLYNVIITEDDWFVYTPEGFFAGSENLAKERVHVVDGLNVYGIDQFYDKLYRPDLVAAKIQGEDISEYSSKISLSNIVNSGKSPVVKIQKSSENSKTRDYQVDFSIKNAGGGIGKVFLSLNGKNILLSESLDVPAGKTANLSHTITLSNGENNIEVYAYNSAGEIESLHSSASIYWEGKTEKPDLYVFAIGVDKYRDGDLRLNYAVSDASAILESFKNQQGGLYKNIYTYNLFDADVTKSKIEKEFSNLGKKIKPDDVFVFYISGHGTAYNVDGDYYFIPVDFRYTSEESIPEKGVSKTDLNKYLSEIKAEKTLVLLDTCNSGAFINSSATRGFTEKTAIERLAKATGHATISASSNSQVAMEGYNDHGIFTWVLTEGLSGKADDNNDEFVSLQELCNYVETVVPELSYEKWNYEQVPQKQLRNQDFPIIQKQ